VIRFRISAQSEWGLQIERGLFPTRKKFIRAPRIVNVGENVEVLAKFNEDPVFVREGNVMATSFHPELTDDLRVHKYFINMVEELTK